MRPRGTLHPVFDVPMIRLAPRSAHSHSANALLPSRFLRLEWLLPIEHDVFFIPPIPYQIILVRNSVYLARKRAALFFLHPSINGGEALFRFVSEAAGSSRPSASSKPLSYQFWRVVNQVHSGTLAPSVIISLLSRASPVIKSTTFLRHLRRHPTIQRPTPPFPG